MKSAQPGILKPGDISGGAMAHFAGAYGRAGGSLRGLQTASDNHDLMRKIVALTDPHREAPSFTYRMSPRQMIDAGGYVHIDNNVDASNFSFGPPPQTDGTHNFSEQVLLPEVEIVQGFGSFKDTMERFRGRRFATLAETLLLGATETSLQREFPIVCVTEESFSYVTKEPNGELFPVLTVAGQSRVLTLAEWDRKSCTIKLWGQPWNGPWGVALTTPRSNELD